jgi:hypothetical protein
VELDDPVMVQPAQRVERLGWGDVQRRGQGVETDRATRRGLAEEVANSTGDRRGRDTEHLDPDELDVGAEQLPALRRSGHELDDSDACRRGQRRGRVPWHIRLKIRPRWRRTVSDENLATGPGPARSPLVPELKIDAEDCPGTVICCFEHALQVRRSDGPVGPC